jgi:hypothetical protein
MTINEQPEKFYSLTSNEKLTITSLSSALVNGDEDMYAIHLERLWHMQQDRTIATLISINMSMHLQMISKDLIPNGASEADAFFLSCYDKFPAKVTRNLNEDDKVSWFIVSFLLRFSGEIEEKAMELISDDLDITTTQLILAATAHAFALSSDPVAYIQEELDAVLTTIPESEDLVVIPSVFTSSYFDESGRPIA